MLVKTREGDDNTKAGYFGRTRAAGLVDLEQVPLPGPTGLIVGRRQRALLCRARATPQMNIFTRAQASRSGMRRPRQIQTGRLRS